MKLIAHRGNVSGANPELENSPQQIDYCIMKGFDVEIDVWYIDRKFYLGHDTYQYEVSLSYLSERSKYLWMHCKNLLALREFQHTWFNYFWHQKDDYTLTSLGYIWTYPGLNYFTNSRQVLLDFSEMSDKKLEYYESLGVYGLCSDYVNYKYL
jgi:hypothetical protein